MLDKKSRRDAYERNTLSKCLLYHGGSKIKRQLLRLNHRKCVIFYGICIWIFSCVNNVLHNKYILKNTCANILFMYFFWQDSWCLQVCWSKFMLNDTPAHWLNFTYYSWFDEMKDCNWSDLNGNERSSTNTIGWLIHLSNNRKVHWLNS